MVQLDIAKNKAALTLTADDFTKMALRSEAYRQGASGANNNTPWGMARQTQNPFKHFKHFIVTVLLGKKMYKQEEYLEQTWKSLAALGYTKDDLLAYKDFIMAAKSTWLPWLTSAEQLLESLSSGKRALTEADIVKLTYDEDVPDLIEDVVEEDVEKHATLNPKLFTEDSLLKDEVREKILQIVDIFVEALEKDGIIILIKDIILIGSNANYNYTKDSDIDIHIITDLSSIECRPEVYNALYSAYRSLFNKKFDVEFYGIPVELYVETEGVPTVSNGIYSVKENDWLKEPIHDKIPDIDKAALAEKVATWQDRGNALILKAKDEKADSEQVYDEIEKYIEDIYELRQNGLKDSDEYSIDNLTFKEVRNLGLLDDLKALKDKMTSKTLSLESLKETQSRIDRNNARIWITRAIGIEPLIQDNGFFFVHNVKEADVARILDTLNRLDCVDHAVRGAAGKYDFSRISPAKLPTRLYTINGKLKDQVE